MLNVNLQKNILRMTFDGYRDFRRVVKLSLEYTFLTTQDHASFIVVSFYIVHFYYRI